MSLSTTRPVGPTSCDHVAPSVPGPAASSSNAIARPHGRPIEERRGGRDRVIVDVVAVGVPGLGDGAPVLVPAVPRVRHRCLPMSLQLAWNEYMEV